MAITWARVCEVQPNRLKRLIGAPHPWRRVIGPGGALLLTCCRLGWALTGVDEIRTDRGQTLNWQERSPRFWEQEAQRATTRWTCRQAMQTGTASGRLWLYPLRLAQTGVTSPLAVACAPASSQIHPALYTRVVECADGCLSGLISYESCVCVEDVMEKPAWDLEGDTIHRAVFGRVPLRDAAGQTAPEAEDYAISRIIDFCVGALEVHTDCENSWRLL
eukprot:18067-Amphidinium_carterae.2